MTFLLVHSPVGADSRVCPNICGLYSENTRNTEKHENIHGSFALNENHEKEQRHHFLCHRSLDCSDRLHPFLLGQTRESAPTRCPKAIQVPLVLRADTGAILRADTGVCPYTCFQGYSDPTPLGRGWGWVIPLGRGRGWVLSLGQEGVGFHIVFAEVLASCGQLMVHQRGQLLLQQEEQPFARLVAVGVHVVFS